MSTRKELVRSPDWECQNLVNYESLEGDFIQISATVSKWYLQEVGYASKGARKENEYVGEAPASIRISSNQSHLELNLFQGVLESGNRPFKFLYPLEIAIMAASECANEQLDMDDAYERFQDKTNSTI